MRGAMATIKLDPARTLGSLDRRVFGGFVEHLGRCIYGGIFDEGSPLSNERGYRRDVLEVAEKLRMPVLRWPGGNFATTYHWIDGVGPREERPRRVEMAWGAEESNRFGTDEFIEYCRLLDAQPYICVNMGTGTLEEAASWVEYCNGTGNTYWANLRRENGYEEPHDVRYWALGNEMYGHWQIGALPAEEYVRKAREFSKAMMAVDPSIELVSCGKKGWSEWDRVVIEGLIPFVNYHSLHIYTGSDDYWSNVLAPHQAERAIDICRALIDRARYRQRIDHPIHVAYDEWNVWRLSRTMPTIHSEYMTWLDEQEPGLEQRHTLADALAVATYLNIFARNSNTVKMANLAQLVNVIAPIFTSPEGLFVQTIYLPLELYAEHLQDVVVDADVRCETRELSESEETSSWPHRVVDLGPFKVLDVVATRDAHSSTLVLAVVNRDPDHEVAATIQVADKQIGTRVSAYEIGGSDPDASNSFEDPKRVSTRRSSVPASGSSFEHEFPAHSVTVLEMSLET